MDRPTCHPNCECPNCKYYQNKTEEYHGALCSKEASDPVLGLLICFKGQCGNGRGELTDCYTSKGTPAVGAQMAMQL